MSQKRCKNFIIKGTSMDAFRIFNDVYNIIERIAITTAEVIDDANSNAEYLEERGEVIYDMLWDSARAECEEIELDYWSSLVEYPPQTSLSEEEIHNLLGYIEYNRGKCSVELH